MSVLTDIRRGYLRITTSAFIADDPTTIALLRQTKVRKPSGGHDFPKLPIAPQVFRFINQDIGGGVTAGADDGTVRRFDYVLVGNHDADVQINDTWVDGQIQYKVDSIIPNNGWETRVHVTGFALEPEHG
jgi:hypothetical protein